MLSKNQIKEIQSLHLRKFREESKRFIVEGIKNVSEVLSVHPSIIEKIFATTLFLRDHHKLVEEKRFSVTEVTEDELKKISLQSAPNAVLAVCNYFSPNVKRFDPATDSALYLDDIRDPGNLGTIIRLCDWFGLSTLFCSPASCESYNPKVVQATMGAFLRVNVQYCTLEDLLKERAIKTVYGALLEGKNIYRENLQPGIIVIGNEANGIGAGNLNLITRPLTIPAAASSGAESLNASVAAAVIVSEFFRQLHHP